MVLFQEAWRTCGLGKHGQAEGHRASEAEVLTSQPNSQQTLVC